METFKPDIVFEDNHLLVVNKPPGLLTQPDHTGQPSLLVLYREWLKHTYNKPGNVFLEVVHRLDKPASGLVLFAKTSKALSRLNAASREKHMHKVYRAKVRGCPPQDTGTLVHYLIHGEHKALVAAKERAEAKEARLTYKVVQKEKEYTLVEIVLETGRYHQIRAQFAHIGCPLLGDTKYGGPPHNHPGIVLQHCRLEIIHPVTKTALCFSL